MKPTLLAIVGKPLAGKDTQADLLVTHYPDSVKISTGHIIRGVREEGETHRFWSIIGPYVPLMEQGMKLPDEPVLAMLREAISEQFSEGKTTLVIAGSPRGEDQLEEFEKIAKENGANLLVFHIDATDNETYKRSALRNEGRVDDTPEIHSVRLKEYEAHVAPMVDRLRREGKIIDIDGMQSIEGVARDIESHIARFTETEHTSETLSEMTKRQVSEGTRTYTSEVALNFTSEIAPKHVLETMSIRVVKTFPETTLPPMSRR